MCPVWISERAATFALYSINTLAFYNRGGECLLRGTYLVLIWTHAFHLYRESNRIEVITTAIQQGYKKVVSLGSRWCSCGP